MDIRQVVKRAELEASQDVYIFNPDTSDFSYTIVDTEYTIPSKEIKQFKTPIATMMAKHLCDAICNKEGKFNDAKKTRNYGLNHGGSMNIEEIKKQLHITEQIVDSISDAVEVVERNRLEVEKQDQQIVSDRKNIVIQQGEVNAVADRQRGEMDKANKMMELAKKLKQTYDTENALLGEREKNVSDLETKKTNLEKRELELNKNKKIIEIAQEEVSKEMKVIEKQKIALNDKQSALDSRKTESDKKKLDYSESLTGYDIIKTMPKVKDLVASIPDNPSKVSATGLLYNFLQNNKMRLVTEVLDQSTPYVGDGFVLVDKPLLKIKAEYIDGE